MRYLSTFFIIIIFLISPNFASAESDSLFLFTRNKRVNIIDLSDRLNVHFYGKIKYTNLEFSCEDTTVRLNYSPNDQINIGFGANWKIFGLGLAFNFKFINNDDDVYGDTKRLDLQVNGYGKKSVLDLTFYSYQSFYLKNIGETIRNWDIGQPNYIRPDINISSFGLSYLYLLNNQQFSYRAAFLSTAQQLKSAGSFFLGGQFSAFKASADSSFFPSQSIFNQLPDLVRVARSSVGFNFGYAYNLILPHKFYVSASLALSPSIGMLNYRFDNTKPNVFTVPSIDIIPRFAAGYNGDNYYFGISHVTRITSIEATQHDVPNMLWQNGNFRFFIGKRFELSK